MGRNKGTFNFAANFEVLAKAPLDAKQLVGTKADLILPATWQDANSNVWLYDGAIVAVSSDSTPANNGVYRLSLATGYTNINNWIKLAEASDIPSYTPENVSNKQNNLNIDGTGTKYPTVDAVNAGLLSVTIADATTTVKGKIKLAGDLSGTADLPIVVGLSGKEVSTNKQNSLTVDGTGLKYPTVDAVNSAIALIPPTPDATSSVKGKLKLTNDLGGTADLPTVPGLALKQDTLSSGVNIKTIEGTSILGSGNIDITATNVGLGNVDNTPDTNKPVSIAQQAALDLKANKSITITTASPLTGGGDLSSNRTFSIPQSTNIVDGYLSASDWVIFNGKQDLLISSINLKTIEGQSLLGSGNIDLTKSDVGLSNVDNTPDLSKPISTATQSALDLKENLSNKENTVLDNSTTKYPTNNLVKTYVDSTITGSIILQGDWNASTNTPDITGTTTNGYAWRVSVAGSTNLGGITTWAVNDLAVKTATGWIKVDNQDTTVVWGNITGTLSAQTDLQSALDAKVIKNTAITGATKAKITYDAKGLVTAGTDLPHNESVSIQGGAPGEYYHLTSTQLSRVLNLINVNSVNSITNLTAISEKGVSTSVSIRYNMLSNDDVFTAASINNGVGSVLSRVNTGNNDVVLGNFVDSTTTTLSMTYLRNGVSTNETKSATYTAVVPKWSNVSATAVINTYALASSNLGTKVLTTATAMNNTGGASAQYIWFITTNSAASIFDGNNFAQSIGVLNAADDGVSEFYKKSFTMTLQDSTTVTMYSYRTRTLKTFSSNIYRIT